MQTETESNILPDSAVIGSDHVAVGGCDLVDLAGTFGTPLYVYDERTLRTVARSTLAAFSPIRARVSYAAKACATLAVLNVFREEGLTLDIVSGGELEAGLRAGFTAAQMHLHGNCKTDAELELAVRQGIRAVVLDNRDEAVRLAAICRRLDTPMKVSLRIALPLEAETHPHLQTSGRHSKFGLWAGEESEVIALLQESDLLIATGVHAHLGSQLHDLSLYARAAAQLIERAERLRDTGLPVEEVSLGGGWAVAYTADQAALSPDAIAEVLAPVFNAHPDIELAVEPGRSLVARSAVALYRVGSVKTSGGARLVAVDGGMGDNPRPALYGAPYGVFLPSTPRGVMTGPVDVVGRYCEAGDFLVRGTRLPHVEVGDLLCIPVAGAYQLSMSSTYNLVPQPAVVMVCGAHAQLITRRATLDDVLLREILSTQ